MIKPTAILLLLAAQTVFAQVQPVRPWAAPAQPLEVRVAPNSTLTLSAFAGESIASQTAQAGTDVVDLKAIFPQINTPGTYVLSDGVSTPLVIHSLANSLRGAPPGPMVHRIVPLRYVELQTDLGTLRLALYYDTAPQTVDAFLRLSADGFYHGLTFHRIIPQFLIQGGDPMGDGTGGPGFTLTPEFSDRPHLEGVVSIARVTDPSEAPGVAPRPEYASSGGSQFFISLGTDAARSLDGRYTAFGRIVSGLDVVRAIAAAPLADAATHRPAKPVVIRQTRVVDVTPLDNPYLNLDTGRVKPLSQ